MSKEYNFRTIALQNGEEYCLNEAALNVRNAIKGLSRLKDAGPSFQKRKLYHKLK